MILFKNESNTNLNQILGVQIGFCARNAIKNETKNVDKNSLFCSILVIFLIFWPLEVGKWHGGTLSLNLIFTYFPIINTSGKFKEIL